MKKSGTLRRSIEPSPKPKPVEHKMKLPTKTDATWIASQIRHPYNYADVERLASIATGGNFNGPMLELLIDWSIAIAHNIAYRRGLEQIKRQTTGEVHYLASRVLEDERS